jgi:hypothetical protein
MPALPVSSGTAHARGSAPDRRIAGQVNRGTFRNDSARATLTLIGTAGGMNIEFVVDTRCSKSAMVLVQWTPEDGWRHDDYD